jgi:alpha-L-fucosidase
MRDLTAGKDTKGRIPYAEWYLNALRVPGSPTARYHQATYGRDVSYFDFRRQFQAAAAEVDFADWARLFAAAGARYVVMVSRHLDGYPLWPTTVANPHMPAEYRSSRDLVGDLTEAVRAQGLRMGLYYGGGLDWTFTDKPIRTMADLTRQQGLGAEYARYATAQWTELVDAYRPSVLWNDVGWPAESDPHQLFAHYDDAVADGVVNDRWTQLRLPASRLARAMYLRFVSLALKGLARAGRSLPQRPPSFHYDFQTHEYAVPEPAPTGPWELCRGLGRSFGYDAQETAADTLTGTQLVHLLVEVVAHGGNLLVNVGPDGGGRVPELQQRPLRELGAWLEGNGEAIYATHPMDADGNRHEHRRPGPLHPQGRHRLRDRPGRRPHRRPHDPRPDPPRRQPGRPPRRGRRSPVDAGRRRPPGRAAPRPTGRHAQVLTITTS